MRSRWFVASLLVTGALTAAPVHAQPADPSIVAVELADEAGELWLATTAGLLTASVGNLAASTLTTADPVWAVEPIAGRTDRPISDLEPLVWPRGEMLMVASEGELWARESPGEWAELGCADEPCPSGITGLSSTYDADAPKEHDLVAFGPEGLWLLSRDPKIAAARVSPPTGADWRWIPLDTGVDVVAASQDSLGRIWAMATAAEGGSELRVYDEIRAAAGPDVVSRPMPSGWEAAAGDSLMTPDPRGGMWLALPEGVLWMNVDVSVHEELDHCDLGLSASVDGTCEAEPDRFSVMSVDNSRDDVWVGSSNGLIRLSVGESGDLAVSSPHIGQPVVSTARNLAGGDLWVASADELSRVEVDRWSWEPEVADAVTAISSGGEPGAEVVLVGTTGGLVSARWDTETATLRPITRPRELDGLVTDISQVLDDGSAFVATELGVTRLAADGSATALPDLADERIAVVEVVDDRVYVGTASGVQSAAVDDAVDAGSFAPVAVSDSAADVTAIWSAMGRLWIGTGGDGLVPVGDPVVTCGDAPPPDAVVRSGAATGDGSFVVVTSAGVYDARPAEGCDVHFQRRSSADTNTAIPAEDYQETVAQQAADRSRLLWVGADHGIDLVAWTGAFTGVDAPVVSQFDRSSFLDGTRVSALASVGAGVERTLLVGTDYGLGYHRPALVPPGFALDAVTPFDATGSPSGEVVDCAVVDCREPLGFDHETAELVLDFTVQDLGDSNRFQFLVDDGEGPPTVSGHELSLATERGQHDTLTITALDLHLNASDPHDVELSVRNRTIGQWFVETNAKWVVALVGVALVAGAAGFWVVRAVRRRGRHQLVDVEVAMRRLDDGQVTVTTTGRETDSTVRLLDTDPLRGDWQRLRTTKDASLAAELGSALFDEAFSRNAARILDEAGLGSRDMRLRMRGLDEELGPLPWEALCTPAGSTIGRARTSIVRDVRTSSGNDATKRLPAVDEVSFPVRVLVVVASPNDRAPLDGVPEELAAIETAAATRYRRSARGAVDVLEHATPEALRTRLRSGDGYDFVHVIAHGERSARGSRLWLEDEDGDAVRIESDELCDLLAGGERRTRRARLVVLNTCSSAEDGAVGLSATASLALDLVRRANVPAVVGMAMQIRTPAAVAFGTAFYRTLFRHGQVDHAMLVARCEVRESDADWLAPRLYVGAPEPELFGGE